MSSVETASAVASEFITEAVRAQDTATLKDVWARARAALDGLAWELVKAAAVARAERLHTRDGNQLALLESEFGGVWIQGGTGAHRAMQAARRGER